MMFKFGNFQPFKEAFIVLKVPTGQVTDWATRFWRHIHRLRQMTLCVDVSEMMGQPGYSVHREMERVKKTFLCHRKHFLNNFSAWIWCVLLLSAFAVVAGRVRQCKEVRNNMKSFTEFVRSAPVKCVCLCARARARVLLWAAVLNMCELFYFRTSVEKYKDNMFTYNVKLAWNVYIMRSIFFFT